MQDLIIPSKRLKKETYILSACFVAAFLTNIVSIITFKTPWYEIFTQIGYVLVITIVLYLIVSFFRFIIYLTGRLIRNQGEQNKNRQELPIPPAK
jgi:uncharacterized membrane protein